MALALVVFGIRNNTHSFDLSESEHENGDLDMVIAIETELACIVRTVQSLSVLFTTVNEQEQDRTRNRTG
jgi:hypothetical protein